MTPVELADGDFADLVRGLRNRGEPFAVATVIRTTGPTAAKPGSKALLDANGMILKGWVGGGCVRGAMTDAVARARESGQPQLVYIRPQDALDEKGVSDGEVVQGVRFASNGCPSHGSADIFVEMVLPRPELLIYGESPVALALARLASGLDWLVVEVDSKSMLEPEMSGQVRMVVIATQGKGDLAALRSALAGNADFVAMVASKRKFSALARKLVDDGVPEELVHGIQVPAGIPIDAVTPDEIALSILAQLTSKRRRHFRDREGMDYHR